MIEGNDFRASYEYTTRFARRAFLAYFWRRFMVLLFATPVIALVCILNLSARESGALAGFGRGRHRDLGLLVQRLETNGAHRTGSSGAAVEILVSTETLTLSSLRVVSTLRWPAVAAIYRTPKFLFVVRLGLSNPTPIPRSILPDDVVAFIEARVREAGGKIQ